MDTNGEARKDDEVKPKRGVRRLVNYFEERRKQQKEPCTTSTYNVTEEKTSGSAF